MDNWKRYYLAKSVVVPDFKYEHVMQSILDNKVESLIPNRIQVIINNLRKEKKI